MADLTPQLLETISAKLRQKTLQGVDSLLLPVMEAADASAPGLRTMVVLAANTRCLALLHRELAILNKTAFSKSADHILATAIVLARYVAEPQGPEGFDMVANWERALTDVERLKEAKQ